jgi:hydrogenase maturation protease
MATGAITTTTILIPAMRTKTRKPRILIAGLGNLLLQDDGVGVHAVRELQQAPLRGVIVADVGCAVLDALHLLKWAEKIVAIDALQAGNAPGTVYACSAGDVAADGVQASLHELNLLAALKFLPPGAHPEIVILGVEPGTIDYGLDLSPAVAAALPRVTGEARRLVARWREETTQRQPIPQ